RLSLHLQGPLQQGPLLPAFTITPYALGALMGSGVAEAPVRRSGARLLVVCAVALSLVSVATAVLISAPGPALWAALGAGGIAFGAFTACAFSLVWPPRWPARPAPCRACCPPRRP